MSSSPAQVQPQPAQRIAALDVARGVAILGTLATNIWLFTSLGGPQALFDTGQLPTDGPLATGLFALSNGKFLALLTVMFGVGLAIQHRSACRRGLPWPGRYPLRAAILLAEGVLHYVLLFEFDVLMGYALAAFLCADLLRRSDRVQRAWAWAVGATYVLLLLATTALLVLVTALFPDAVAAAEGEPAEGRPADTASYLAQVAGRLEWWPLYRAELLLIVPSAVVLFLVGAALWRAGVFGDDAAGSRLRVRLLIVGAVAFPLNVATAYAGPAWLLVDRYLLPPLVAVGLLALVAELVRRWRPGPGRVGLDAIGRTALSCYVLQNLLPGVLCFDWGFGLARPIATAGPVWGPIAVVGLWAAIGLVLAGAALLWLRRFDRGPVEAIAHGLAAPRRARGAG